MTAATSNCRRVQPTETEIGRMLSHRQCRVALTVLDLDVAMLECHVTEAQAVAMRRASRKAPLVNFTSLAGGLVEVDAYVNLETAGRMLQALELGAESRPQLH